MTKLTEYLFSEVEFSEFGVAPVLLMPAYCALTIVVMILKIILVDKISFHNVVLFKPSFIFIYNNDARGSIPT